MIDRRDSDGKRVSVLENRGGSTEVVLLTQPDCGFCDQAKAVVERVAKDFAMRISQVDLRSSEGEALALQGGVLFPPGVFLDGELFSYGRLSERKLRRELTKRGERA